MTDALNFRSAFNGFNREDVVHYIEYLNSNHENQIKQLQADLAAAQKEMLMPTPSVSNEDMAALQEQCNQQEAIIAAANAEKDELVGRCAQLETALNALNAQNQELMSRCGQDNTVSDALNAQVQELTSRCAQQETIANALSAQNQELLARCAQLEAAVAAANTERDAALAAKPQANPYAEEELAAYRRAERVEREANERANAIYNKLQAMLQDTASKTNAAATNLDGIAEQMNSQMTLMRTALADSKSYIDQTAASIVQFRPAQKD